MGRVRELEGRGSCHFDGRLRDLIALAPLTSFPALHHANISLCQTVKPRWGTRCVFVCVRVPGSDIEQGLLHRESKKDEITHLKRPCLKVTHTHL